MPTSPLTTYLRLQRALDRDVLAMLRVTYASVSGELLRLQGRAGIGARVRILKEYGRCDISYIHATVGGKQYPVRIDMPSGGIGIFYRGLKGEFIAWAKEQGVFAKGLGLLDEGNWSVLNG